MSGVASMGIPGRIPTFCSAGSWLTPDALFKDDREKAAYRGIIEGRGYGAASPAIKVGKVCVRIFDLSDPVQVSEYEKLWAELLEKASRNEVIVESQKDLVHRKDGTSYWMKYVEYVEFGEAEATKTDGEKK